MKSLGRYSLYCHASSGQLQEYFDNKYQEFLDTTPDSVKIAANCIGLQSVDPNDNSVIDLDLDEDDLMVWVLNPYMHVKADGTTLSVEESPFIWLGDLMKRSLRPGGGQVNIASHKYASTSNTIGVPYSESILAMRKMIIALKESYLNNFPAALMVIGSQLLNLHFERLLPVTGGVPVGLLYGDVQCGKTRIIEYVLSLLGIQNTPHYLKRCPDMKFMTATEHTTLNLVLDDITDHEAICEKILMVFDGKDVEYHRVSITPRTSFMASVNIPCFKKIVKRHRFV